MHLGVVFADKGAGMQHWEIPSEAREIRTRVEALIDRHDIAPTPVNYTLWF